MRNDRPLIGILGSRDGDKDHTPFRYQNAAWAGGGFGIVLPFTTDEKTAEEYVSLCDGFMFSGGVDVDPKYYGEEIQFDSVEVDPQRDDFEKLMFEKIYPTGKPILGICRGIQSINVWMGGSLYQHIGDHRQKISGDERPQPLTAVEGGMLARIAGKTDLHVNSFHHQNVKTLGKGLVADAYSEEGYVEAVWQPDYPTFLFAIQFHPEIYFWREDDDHSLKIFKAFVDACR